jgi:hypothetical protein
MIKNKIFVNETLLNEFVEQNNVRVISIETKKDRYDTGLPLLTGGSFFAERDVLKVWYEENVAVCRSSFNREFKVGQLVCSYGDETTAGRVRYWDEQNKCWAIQLITGTKGYTFWPNDEPQPIPENKPDIS